MKKPFLQQFTANLHREFSKLGRQVRRRRQGRERALRQEEVIKLARSQRAARANAARLRGARRTVAQQVADVQDTLRWTAFQRAAQQGVKKAIKTAQQAARSARAQNPVVRRFAFRFLALAVVCSLLGNIVLYYRYSSSRPLVTIGKRVVEKSEFLKDLHDAAGKAVLNKIVYEELINQAAAKAGVMPSEKDITERLADLRRRTPGKVPAEDTPALRSEVSQVIALENLRMEGVPASDQEIAAYYAVHKADFTLPPQAQASLVVTEKAADAAEAVQLLAQEMPEAAIAAHPGLHVAGIDGFQVNMNVLPPAVRTQLTTIVMGMKTGEIKTLTLGKTFLTFRMKNHDAGSVLPLSQVKNQVARQVKLQKAPSEQAEMVALYKSNKPNFDMANYKDYFSDLENAASPAKPGDAPKTASLPQ